MKIEILPIGDFDANCVLISEGGMVLVTDPGAEPAELDARLKKQDLEVGAYLLTHGHVDHLGGLYDLWKRRPAPVLIHPADAAWAFTSANELLPYYAAPKRPDGPYPDVQDGSTFKFASLSFNVIGTPGHSPGCVCYYFEKDGVLLTGDTLFQNSVGRTDLPGGDGRVLAESLVKLAALPPAIKVIPGHGDATTMGEEIRSNFFMQTAARTLARKKPIQ
jgi:hydroxyacylglutathione hydrolase